MLSPDYLLRISEGAEDIAGKLHNDIISRIVERMTIRIGRGESYLLTAQDKWQIQSLQEAGYLMEDIQRDIAAATRLQQKEIAEAMEDAGVRALQYDDRIYRNAGLSPVPLTQSPYMMRLMQRNYEATLGEWYNFTRTTADTAQRTFINVLDNTYMLVASGALSYTQAVKEAVQSLVSDGIEVVYPTGHRDTIETATLRAVRTGVSQASAQIQLARMDEMDVDLVLVSSHLGARPSHQVWQGKIYSRSGKGKYPEFVASTGYGSVSGLCGANCRHNFGPYFEGMDNPFDQYDSEENQKAYELQQRQRELERRIRKTKREVMGYRKAIDSATDDNVRDTLDSVYQRKAALLQKQNAAYNDFCEENGLKRLNDRISVARWDRRQAAAARGAAQRYGNGRGNSVNSAVDKIGATNCNNTRTANELQNVAQDVRNNISNYADSESRWSNNININNALILDGVLGQKEWNCDISLVNTVDDGIIWHEMLHSCSCSHYDESIYFANQAIEEASVEFLKQQICKEQQIVSVHTYEKYTKILETINDKFGYGTDMEFAKELFNIPLPDRYQWLENKVDDSLRTTGASFSDYNDVMFFIQELKGAIL